MEPTERERELARLVRAHDRWRGRSVFNLLASENALSPTALRYLASDLAGRYTLPHDPRPDVPGSANDYGGTQYTDRIEQVANAAASRLFHGRFATTRPLSGHLAAMSALVPLVPRGGRILAIPPEAGGYDGYAPGYLPAMFGWEVRPLPASGEGCSIVATEAAEEIRRQRPDVVVLGQSRFLFPYPLREIAEAAHAVGALVVYDAAHVLGLIAGGTFQDPLSEGADLLYGSTHKSLPGPQGGLLVTDREDLFRQIEPALTWRVFDNAHWNRIASLGQTLLELERMGPEYARTVVANARALGAALADRGLPIVAPSQGFTRSHQIHMDPRAVSDRYDLDVADLSERWECSRLVSDRIGRLGTAEITRLGLRPEEMPRLSDLLYRSGIGRERIASEVLRWRRSFRGLRFQ